MTQQEIQSFDWSVDIADVNRAAEPSLSAFTCPCRGTYCHRFYAVIRNPFPGCASITRVFNGVSVWTLLAWADAEVRRDAAALARIG